jgi:hypothetical protein
MANPYYSTADYDPRVELTNFLKARAELKAGGSYSIGGRSYTPQDIDTVSGMIAILKREVDALDGRSTVALARFDGG